MCFNPLYIQGQYFACGKCVECKLKRSREWAFRNCLEASLYEENCFLTLTYNDDCLPKDNSLSKNHVQSFIKNLRRHIEYGDKYLGIAPNSIKIRFFAVGEYGSLYGRPHYHVLIFGWSPKDKYFFGYDKRGNEIYRSTFLEKVWKFGFSTVGDITYKSALYCSLYMQKAPSDTMQKPFILMSRGCALGFEAVSPNCLKTDKIFVNGKYMRVPRVYVEKFEKLGYDLTDFKIKRLEKNKKVQDEYVFELYNVEQRKKNFFEKFRSLFKKRVKVSKITGEIDCNEIVSPYFQDVSMFKNYKTFSKYCNDIKIKNDIVLDELLTDDIIREKNIKSFVLAIDNNLILDYNNID